jgi:hypothetical protein
MPSTPKPTLVHQIIDPVGHSFPIRQGEEVIHIHAGIFPFCLPFSTIVLEVPKQFLLFTVNGNLRIPFLLELIALLIDMLKLSIAVWVLFSFDRLLVRSQGKMTRVQQFCQG